MLKHRLWQSSRTHRTVVTSVTLVFNAFGKLSDWRELLTICSTSISGQSKTFLQKLVGKASRQQVDGLSCVTVSSRVFESMTLKRVNIATLLLSKQGSDPTF